ncbi:hypothetical protein KCP69_25965 [Salmonella enterica subsp. enterica]|nr:hypothetical protein KCP69_25965 [Salmonella enterica subsp. enterica]
MRAGRAVRLEISRLCDLKAFRFPERSSSSKSRRFLVPAQNFRARFSFRTDYAGFHGTACPPHSAPSGFHFGAALTVICIAAAHQHDSVRFETWLAVSGTRCVYGFRKGRLLFSAGFMTSPVGLVRYVQCVVADTSALPVSVIIGVGYHENGRCG